MQDLEKPVARVWALAKKQAATMDLQRIDSQASETAGLPSLWFEGSEVWQPGRLDVGSGFRVARQSSMIPEDMGVVAVQATAAASPTLSLTLKP